MNLNKNTYQTILKATAIFGGVQVSSIIISIIRSKFLAILIGPSGYGIFSLLNSTIELIRTLTGFGLETSGVKKIVEAKETKNNQLLIENTSLLVRLGIITGIVGTTISIILSPLLSKFSFGNAEMTVAFLLISISILFKQITSSNNAIFQGLSELKLLAKSNLYGNVFGLLFTLPFYYYFHIKAIVPSIILTSFIHFIISFFYFKKLSLKKVKIENIDSIRKGKEILFFGGLLTISSFLPLLSNYLIQIFINKLSGLEVVGVFSVGLIIINSYVGIVFNAMSTEYYPRLVKEISNKEKLIESINKQAIFTLLLITPIIILFLWWMPFIIKILFSTSFLNVIPFITWAIVAMIFKSVSWSFGMVIIAKADAKLFIKTALIFNTIYLLLCYFGYAFYGLEGLGLAFLMYFFIHLIGVLGVVKWQYEISLTKRLFLLLLKSSSITGLALLAFYLDSFWIKNSMFLLALLFGLLLFYKEIVNQFSVISSFKQYLNKRGK